MTWHAAIYIRKSREDESKAAHRLQAQRELLPAHALGQGWTYALYDDGFASAARGKAEFLPERGRLETDVRAGRVHIVLCLELSRLSRDDTLQDYLRLLALCAEHGTRLATPSRILDPRESSDWFLLLLEGGFSSVEMRLITQRLKQGQARAWEAGGHVGGAIPRPYRKGVRPGELVIDPDERERVLRVLHAYARGGRAEALPVLRGCGWHPNTLANLVSEAGLSWYTARRLSREHPGEWIRCTWPPLLTDDEADEIRRRRSPASRVRLHARRSSLLAGLDLLRCGYCEGGVTGQTGGADRAYYVCYPGQWHGRCSHYQLIRQRDLDDAVVTHLIHSLQDAPSRSAAWAAAAVTDETGDMELRTQERDLRARKKRLVLAVETAALPLDEAGPRMRELQTELEEVRARRAALPGSEPEPDWSTLARVVDAWPTLPLLDQRELVHSCLARITVHNTYALLTYRWALDPSGRSVARVRLPAIRRVGAAGKPTETPRSGTPGRSAEPDEPDR